MEYLSAKQLAARLSVSVRTIWRLTAAGRLPQPVRLGRRMARWREADVQRVLDQLANGKGGRADEPIA